jgi:predicted PurR-regulated permease PerM
MPSSDENAAGFLEDRALLVLLIAVTLAFGWILLPFYGPILWAAVIALLFAPLQRWLVPRLGGRRTPAALLTLLTIVLIVMLPFALITAALAREAMQLYEQLQAGTWDATVDLHRAFDALPHWAREMLDRIGLASFDTVQRRLAAALAQFSSFVATHAFGITQDTFDYVVGLFITLYLTFFLIRDGEAVVRMLRHALPLAPLHKQELFEKFATVIRATVKGSLLVAAVQGALGGIAFWFLGLSGALLWAVLMAVLSLLPALGAALVWLPVAVYLLLTGALWQSVALVAWGVLVIGLVDNVLRPVLVGKDTGMPDYVVMITTLGGLAVFGVNGLIVGPAIAAMFIAVWHIYGTMQAGDSASKRVQLEVTHADARRKPASGPRAQR